MTYRASRDRNAHFTFSEINPVGAHFLSLLSLRFLLRRARAHFSVLRARAASGRKLGTRAHQQEESVSVFSFSFFPPQHQRGGKAIQSPPPPDPSALGCALMSDSELVWRNQKSRLWRSVHSQHGRKSCTLGCVRSYL